MVNRRDSQLAKIEMRQVLKVKLLIESRVKKSCRHEVGIYLPLTMH